eukprot:TRINITY_DN1676_c0_g1_i1.p1 TRINITY_DN1676_c0_g1~~TRINITY_DN1676_c0_g1_i1.p1  ORF type:complete len:147 (+),score=18.66 TRINITY_DN1676_c0_g1_i1:43-441(+)
MPKKIMGSKAYVDIDRTGHPVPPYTPPDGKSGGKVKVPKPKAKSPAATPHKAHAGKMHRAKLGRSASEPHKPPFRVGQGSWGTPPDVDRHKGARLSGGRVGHEHHAPALTRVKAEAVPLSRATPAPARGGRH